MVEAYQIHATLQVTALMLYLGGTYFARRHKLTLHHRFVYTSLAVNTLAVALMIAEAGGLPTLHGQLGFIVYLYMVITMLSGILFLKYRTLTRRHHKLISYTAIAGLSLMIVNGLLTFVIRII